MTYILTALIAFVVGCVCGYLLAPTPPPDFWSKSDYPLTTRNP